MKLASSLYKGGELLDASEADYECSKEFGMVCPFCKEAVFLAREHTRKNSNVRASWRHYRVSIQSAFCEERALSVQGKEILKQLQPEARGQRLKLFNRRFWDVYKYEKDVPPLDAATRRILDDRTVNLLVNHCREKWDVPVIMQSIPGKIESILAAGEKRGPGLATILNNVGLAQLTLAEQKDVLNTAQNSLDYFADLKFSVLRHKILSEVIEWLPTETASTSFRKVIQLAIIDRHELAIVERHELSKSPLPLHSSVIANMAVSSLILTDWEVAIANLKEPQKGLGFAKS